MTAQLQCDGTMLRAVLPTFHSSLPVSLGWNDYQLAAVNSSSTYCTGSRLDGCCVTNTKNR